MLIMFRRQLFYGITLILVVVIIFLLMRGRSSDKEREARNVRLQEAAVETASPVRAILPRDLEIVEATVSWTRNPGEKDAAAARHDMTIRNTGEVSYISLWLRMEYIDEKGRPVEIRTHEVNETVPSGGTLRVPEITIDALPDTASDYRAAILSADL
jgi:hypothetical protein